MSYLWGFSFESAGLLSPPSLGLRPTNLGKIKLLIFDILVILQEICYLVDRSTKFYNKPCRISRFPSPSVPLFGVLFGPLVCLSALRYKR